MTEELKTMPCGCKVTVEYGKGTDLVYCSLHKSAPDLYEALKRAHQILKDRGYRDTMLALIPIVEALAKAEGKE